MNGVVALRVTKAGVYSRHGKSQYEWKQAEYWLTGYPVASGDWLHLLTSTKPEDVGLILRPFTLIYSLRAAGGEKLNGSCMVACAAEDNRAPNVEPDVCPG